MGQPQRNIYRPPDLLKFPFHPGLLSEEYRRCCIATELYPKNDGQKNETLLRHTADLVDCRDV